MVTSPIPLSRYLLRQKNIWLTAVAFVIGLVLQLADTSLVLIVLGVAVLSSWWYWHPTSPNAESQLILDTLQRYPAVTIKHYNHIIAFNSSPPCLAAAYQSPIPLSHLKRYLSQEIFQGDGMELSLSREGLTGFLVIKSPLASHTNIKQIFQMFQSLIAYLEIQIQYTVLPAERYQILRLFGLDRYVKEPDNTPTMLRDQSSIQTSERPLVTSQKIKQLSLLIDS